MSKLTLKTVCQVVLTITALWLWLGPAAAAAQEAKPPADAKAPAEAPKAAPAAADSKPPAKPEAAPKEGRRSESAIRKFILSKMEYDRFYFTQIQEAEAKGKTPANLTRDKFIAETHRAKLNLPVLNKFFSEVEAYKAGRYFALPASKETYRVYTNLLAILNMFLAVEKGEYQVALEYGGHVVISGKETLGLVRDKEADYYVELYREYYYMMAASNYRMGRDDEGVRWFVKIEADADLKKLKEKISKEEKPATVDLKALRLEELRVRPVAVMNFKALAKDPDTDWIENGVPEILTSDLIQYTDLVIVERAQLDKLLREIELSQTGVTDEQAAEKAGKMLSAGSVLAGSYKKDGSKILFTFRVIDAQNAQGLDALTVEIPHNDDLFKGVRKGVLDLFVKMGWMYQETAGEILAMQAPKADTIRNLMKARVLRATKSADAKILYAKAIKEDPRLANLFKDLKDEFKDVAATVAVTPFVNVTGLKEDVWMVGAVSESLSTDLPKMKFTVVERARLGELFDEKVMGQVLDNDKVSALVKKAGADFMVMGSVMHQAPQIRLAARFVDLKSGIVMFSVSVDNLKNDFMAALVDLSKSIAKELNEKLSEDTIDKLAGKKMSEEDFKKYVRQQLAKDSLAYAQMKDRGEAPTAEPERPMDTRRVLFWTAAGGAAAGAALTVLGFSQGAKNSNDAYYYDGLYFVSNDPTLKEDYKKKRDDSAGTSTMWNAIGFGGVGLAVISAGYLIYDSIAPREAPATRVEVSPQAFLDPATGATTVGVAGKF
jgi:TolB-like protein